MPIRIETTVQNGAAKLKKSGASGEQKVFLTIYDDEETAKLEALRADIQIGLDQAERGEVIEGDACFAGLREKLTHQYLKEEESSLMEILDDAEVLDALKHAQKQNEPTRPAGEFFDEIANE